MGCKAESFVHGELDMEHKVETTSNGVDPANGFLTTNSDRVSPFMLELMKELGMNRIKAGGTGMLTDFSVCCFTSCLFATSELMEHRE